MAKEIGSEFWNVPISKVAHYWYPVETRWFLSGRSALRAIIEQLEGCRTAALPSWCCDSMIRPFLEAGMHVYFYPVFINGRVVQKPRFDCDVLLVMDYFGYSASMPDFDGYEGIVIRDLTHSIFSSRRNDADYYFGSLRKWCGVYTGGFAWGSSGKRLLMARLANDEYVDLRTRAMALKQEYISKVGLENESKKEYLPIFEQAEKLLDIDEIWASSDRDVALAPYIDVEHIRHVRARNAEVLMEAFEESLLFPELAPDDCPLFVPVLIPDGMRDALRKHLIRRAIYCPVHWPLTNFHMVVGDERELYRSELSLICDQRYEQSDMRRIVETIKDFGFGG